MKYELTYLSNPGIVQRLGRAFMSLFAAIVFKTYVRLKIKGREHIPSHPFIICSNHQSHLDGVILSHIANRNYRHTAMIAAKDYWFDYKPRHRFASIFFNLIPIGRKGGTEGFSFNHTKEIVRAFLSDPRKSVVILPEGSRSRTGKIGTFKKGITFLAAALDLPIVPVYLDGTKNLWPKGKLLIRPGVIHITIGAPIVPEALGSENNVEIVRERILEMQKNG